MENDPLTRRKNTLLKPFRSLASKLRKPKRSKLKKEAREACARSRARVTELLGERNYTAALQVCREVCKSPYAWPTDHSRRTRILHALGKAHIVKRYVAWLHNIYEQGRISRADFAARLWAAWLPKSALEILGERENWQENTTAEIAALRSLIDLRRFAEARELAESSEHPTKISTMHDRATLALNALSDHGIATQAGQDAAYPVLENWLEHHKTQPAPAYTSVSGRVLLYSHSLGIGGAERQVTHLVANLAQDTEVSSLHLLLKEQPKNAFELAGKYEKFSTHLLSDMGGSLPEPWDEAPIYKKVIPLAEVAGLRSLNPVLRAIYELKPEVIHVRGGLHAEVALAAVLAGVPRVVVHFGSMTRGQQSFGSEIENLREKLTEHVLGLCALFPQVVLTANSRAAADDWALATGLPKDRFTTIYNAIEPGELGFSDLGPFDAKTDRPLTVGGVFRFSPVKDPLLWVTVAQKVNEAIPGTRFLMVGDGPLRHDIEKAVQSAGLGDQFILPGMVSGDLFDYLRQMDLFLMTTQTESLPNAVIEAQLAGLPVVAPDVGGISEAIAATDTGRLTDRDAETLAQAVIDGLRDERWRASVHERSPKLILDRFSRRAQLDAVKEAYGWN